MAVGIFDTCYAFLDGQLLAEAVTVKIEWDGDDQDIVSLARGWHGQTPSPRSIMVTIDQFVPITGFEVDIIGKFLRSEKVTLGLQLGGSGLKLNSEGFLRKPSMESGAGQSTKVSFSFKGEASPFI